MRVPKAVRETAVRMRAIYGARAHWAASMNALNNSMGKNPDSEAFWRAVCKELRKPRKPSE